MSIIAALDTETTGLLDPEHRIIEVYVELFGLYSRKSLFQFNERINPKRSITTEAERVHKISTSDLLHKRPWEDIGPLVHKVIDKADFVIAHNAPFDRDFLDMEFKRIGLSPIRKPVYCTMENGVWAAPNGKKPSLQELCFACDVEYDPSKAHAADYDVRVMTEAYFRGLDWGFYSLPEAT